MNNVFALRNSLGMTQDEFAEHCKVARISIARFETGAQISRASAQKIAQACNVSVSYVLGEETIKKEAPSVAGLRDGLIDLLVDLSPEEEAQLRAFVAGMKANRKP